MDAPETTYGSGFRDRLELEFASLKKDLDQREDAELRLKSLHKLQRLLEDGFTADSTQNVIQWLLGDPLWKTLLILLNSPEKADLHTLLILFWLAQLMASAYVLKCPVPNETFCAILCNLLKALSDPDCLASAVRQSTLILILDSIHNIKPNLTTVNLLPTLKVIFHQYDESLEVQRALLDVLQYIIKKEFRDDSLVLVAQIAVASMQYPTMVASCLELLSTIAMRRNTAVCNALRQLKLIPVLLPLLQSGNEKAASICSSLCMTDPTMRDELLTEPVIIAMLDMISRPGTMDKNAILAVLSKHFSDGSDHFGLEVTFLKTLVALLSSSASSMVLMVSRWALLAVLNGIPATRLFKALQLPRCLHHILHCLLQPDHAATWGRARELAKKIVQLGDSIAPIVHLSSESAEPCNPYVECIYAAMQLTYVRGANYIGLGCLDLSNI